MAKSKAKSTKTNKSLAKKSSEYSLWDIRNLKPIDPNEASFNLSFHLEVLLREEPFFAKVSRYIKKVPTKSIPTAGVRLNINTLSFEMMYNPDFFLSLENKQRLWVFMHEFYHICLGHCTDRKPVDVSPQKANIAMDEAVNSLPNMVKDAPNFAIVPGRQPPSDLPKTAIAWIVKDHPPGEAMEYYLNKLPDNMIEDSFDIHVGWDISDEFDQDASDAMKEIAAYKLREIIQKAADESDKESVSGSNGWGTVSMEIRKLIKDGLQTKLDPKKVLAYFIKSSVKAEKRHRLTKINRRFPYIHPGKTYTRLANVAISIDQSGSVSDVMLEMFYSWLNEFSKFATFTVIPFDDSVFEDKIFIWKKGEKRPRERVLCGGTNFDAPTNYVNKHPKFDGHIIVTDLCAPAPGASKVQRIWVTDKQCANNHHYLNTNERILAVD